MKLFIIFISIIFVIQSIYQPDTGFEDLKDQSDIPNQNNNQDGQKQEQKFDDPEEERHFRFHKEMEEEARKWRERYPDKEIPKPEQFKNIREEIQKHRENHDKYRENLDKELQNIRCFHATLEHCQQVCSHIRPNGSCQKCSNDKYKCDK